ncbi:cell wall-binding repeat-containing protein [Herbiconiux sp. VKM Ac-2851]|uniref:cell wall-binding repeat-containing protein n=1 Tax=Herbiconiux sp. VKM Ac-2851 TaxID=2739025 RepID=UPI001565EF87|nr:cell wall-binding repeat-containing protein [Herbiconiux sp. VKM Ac-2851]NQX34874.1 cell wall-binding repeat-containing protein [Herbiconiux sp. VKM Ac-2851]
MTVRPRIVIVLVAALLAAGAAPGAAAESPGVVSLGAVSLGAVPFVRDTITVPHGPKAGDELAVDPVSRQLYLTGDGVNGVSVFDTTSRRFTTSIATGPEGSPGRYPSGIGIDSSIGRVFVADESDDTVTVIDVTSNAVIERIELAQPGQTLRAHHVAVDPIAHRAYVLNLAADFISVVDTVSLQVIGAIDEFGGVTADASDLAIDPGLHKGYVIDSGAGTVSVFDTLSGKASSTITAGIGGFPRDIAVDAIRHRAYTADYTTQTVSIIDTARDVAVGTVPVGSGPMSIAIDSSSQLVYVMNLEGETVSVIDATAGRVLTILEQGGRYGTGPRPSAVAVDESTSTAYVLSWPTGSIAVVASGRSRTSTIERQGGADRYGTAAEVSRQTFAPGVPVAYIASGAAFPDALSGGAAAAADGGPVLLVAPDDVPAVVAAELRRLRPARIVVLGGSLAVSDGVLAALKAFAPKVDRIGGADRFEVSAAVSAETFAEHPTVAFVASGAAFPDALAGGAAAGLDGAPMLLTRRDGVPAAVTAELRRLKPDRIVLLGGQAAVSGEAESELRLIAPTSRLSGADRFAVSAAISHESFPVVRTDTVFIASGETFPDALAGSPAAVTTWAPVLLARRDSLPQATVDELDRLRPSRIVVLGGPAAISAATMDKLKGHLR